MMNYKIGMISLGCPKNQVDGEIMLEKLNKSGFGISPTIEDSDIMIINTCGFIEDAKKEAIDTILEVAQYKEAGIISAIVVTGCLAERYQDEILKEFPEVDSVIGIGADRDIVKVCQKVAVGISTSFFPKKEYLLLETEREQRLLTQKEKLHPSRRAQLLWQIAKTAATVRVLLGCLLQAAQGGRGRGWGGKSQRRHGERGDGTAPGAALNLMRKQCSIKPQAVGGKKPT